ncbi:transposase [Candidatus Gracilibacteria bacterium]|nr:transposase [Candidatus Gracilibacteria bacterium]
MGRAIGKTEEQVAHDLMAQLKERGHPDAPPPMATDGNGDYRTALVDTWGEVPDYCGRGRPPTRTQPHPDWQYVQVVKERSGYQLTAVHITVVYGDPEEVLAQVGGHTAYVERTNLTARQMNGRLVRKTLSYSKQREAWEAACAWEDWVYNLTRTLDTLSIPERDGQRRWKRQTPAMEAGLSDHRWTIKELLSTVVAPPSLNT